MFFFPLSPLTVGEGLESTRRRSRTSCTYVFIHVRQMAYLPSNTTKSKRSICHGTAHKATYTAQRTDHRTHETSAVETLPFGLAYIFIPLLGISSVSTLAYARAQLEQRDPVTATPSGKVSADKKTKARLENFPFGAHEVRGRATAKRGDGGGKESSLHDI